MKSLVYIARLILLTFLWMVGGKLTASTVQEVPVLQALAPVKMRVESLYDRPTERGMLPVRITVNNNDDKDLVYTWTFALDRLYDSKVNLRFHMKVPAKSEVVSTYYLPILIYDTYGNNIGYRVEGPFCEKTFGSSYVSLFKNSSNTSHTSYIGIGSDAAQHAAKKIIESRKQGGTSRSGSGDDWNGSVLRSDLIPEDPIGLEGMDHVVLSEVDWRSLKPLQQKALKAWAFSGGNLWFMGADSLLQSFSNISLGENKKAKYGLGSISVIQSDADSISVAQFSSVRLTLGFDNQGIGEVYRQAYQKSLGFSWVVFGGLLPLYALLAGPLNLFYIAKAGRRQRLFWTVPLIALAMTAVLLIYIAFSDGIGAKGKRFGILLLNPNEQLSLQTQSELVRTGLLLSRNFSTHPNTMVHKLDSMKIGFSSSSDYKAQRDVVLQGNEAFYHGKWYENRTLQSITAQKWEAKRGTYQVSPDLYLISSSNEHLDHGFLSYGGRIWKFAELMPGEKVKLEASSMQEFHEEFKNKYKVNSPSGELSSITNLIHQEGWMLASSAAPAQGFVPTLDATKWEEEKLLVITPISMTK